MFGRIVSTAISNPWLKPLTRNVSNVVVELLNYLMVETDNFLLLLVTREQ
jgi:hypothetical protein